MRIRYASWLTLGVAAAFLVVASSSFALSSISAITLGVSVGTTVAAAAMAIAFRKHVLSAGVAVAASILSGWTIVASQVFSQTTVQNLSLAAGLGLAGLAIIGMTAHELDSERVVHSLEVGATSADREAALAQ
jgi:hypothetical protein